MDNHTTFSPTTSLTTIPSDVTTIDCDTCVMNGTEACNDCLVNFVVSRQPGEAVVIDAAEERSLRALAGEGMVPQLRYLESAG